MFRNDIHVFIMCFSFFVYCIFTLSLFMCFSFFVYIYTLIYHVFFIFCLHAHSIVSSLILTNTVYSQLFKNDIHVFIMCFSFFVYMHTHLCHPLSYQIHQILCTLNCLGMISVFLKESTWI